MYLGEIKKDMKKIKKNNKEEWNLKVIQEMLNQLINDNKIKFEFYNNSLLQLDLLQMCYNKIDNKLELKFRDVMGEHINELKKIMTKRNNTT